VAHDNFHAYWSPTGRQIVWTHTEAFPLAKGGQRWEMLLGDFSVRGGVPSLNNVRVVGRPYGVYETQPWAPDGTGFLFSGTPGRPTTCRGGSGRRPTPRRLSPIPATVRTPPACRRWSCPTCPNGSVSLGS
jgi:hypothetical protein